MSTNNARKRDRAAATEASERLREYGDPEAARELAWLRHHHMPSERAADPRPLLTVGAAYLALLWWAISDQR
jgi:hypothetical protein